MNTLTLTVRAASAALVLALAGGCTEMPSRDVADCSLSNTNNIDRLFEQVSGRLETPACHYRFHDYQQRLEPAAKSAPQAAHEARFAGQLRTSIDLAIITKRPGWDHFSRSFAAESQFT